MNKQDLELLVFYLKNTKRSKTQQFVIDSYVLKKLLHDDGFMYDVGDELAERIVSIATVIKQLQAEGINRIGAHQMYLRYLEYMKDKGNPVTATMFGRMVKELGTVSTDVLTQGTFYNF